MSLTTEQIDRIRSEVEQTILDFFALFGRRDKQSVERALGFFGDTVHGYGSGEHEVIAGLDVMREILETDFGATPGGVDIEVTFHSLEPLTEHHVTVSSRLDMKVSAGDEVLELWTRHTAVLERGSDGRWRFVHSHISFPHADQAPGESLPVDALQARAERLEREVAQRTAELSAANHELRVEAAVERVRAEAMAMRETEDIMGVLSTLASALGDLDMGEPISSYACIVHDDGRVTQWDISEVDEEGSVANFNFTLDPSKYEQIPRLKRPWDEDEAYWITRYDPDQLDTLIDEVTDVDAESGRLFREAVDSGHIPDYIQVAASFSKGFLGLDFTEPPGEHVEGVLTKMAAAFGLAWRRFEDLQQAEHQAREAQIEAALERVRSRTMGMQTSDELREVVATVYRELDDLGLDAYGCSLATRDGHGEDGFTLWWSSEVQSVPPEPYTVPWLDHPFHDGMRKGWDDAPGLGEYVLEGESHRRYLRLLFEETDLSKLPEDVKEWMARPERIVLSEAFMPHVIVEAVVDGSLPGEQATVLRRFAGVFEQTYTRFLDLQEAETRARESEIEAAMERIRGRALAMRSSDELKDVVLELRRQIDGLGQLNVEAGVVHIYTEGADQFESIAAVRPPGKDGRIVTAAVTFPTDEPDVTRRMMDLWKSDQTEYTIELDRQAAEEWQRHMLKWAPDLGQRREEFIEETKIEGHQEWWHIADFSEGSVILVSHASPTDETMSVLRKTADVFDLAYRRYRDLESAEARAREAEIESALERVRSSALAMTTSDELLDIIFRIHNEFAGLGFPCEQFWQTKYTPEVYQKALTGAGGQKIAAIMELPRDFTAVPELAAWERGDEPIGVFKFDPDAAWTYIHHMIEKGKFDELDPEGMTEEDIRSNGGLTFVQARTSHGEIGYALWGETDPSEEAKDVLVRFAGAFDLAYRRFEDLQQAEQDLVRLKEEKERTERALTDLRATQKQLIEQEKLASLGSLTAGIAHEIKNPLNFVNNFAEVSEELLDELAAAVSAGDSEEAAALLGELRVNARQIAKHGGRADAIVRSMMQHARGGASERETIEVNTFVEEYVDLAWHGMRARDHTFQCDVERALDPDAGTIEGQPQELGRVLLNLLNNAFYAVSMEGAAAEPVVRVSTARSNGRVRITVEDSGPGIPDNIREKIFEPFFTTKPTGEGTGLGLSLSYDIVTKGHGGEMHVDDAPGGGARFTVRLPAG